MKNWKSKTLWTTKTFISAFDFRVGNRAMSDADKLHYLHQYVSGESRDLIGGHWPMIKSDQQIRNLSSFITHCLCALLFQESHPWAWAIVL